MKRRVERSVERRVERRVWNVVYMRKQTSFRAVFPAGSRPPRLDIYKAREESESTSRPLSRLGSGSGAGGPATAC